MRPGGLLVVIGHAGPPSWNPDHDHGRMPSAAEVLAELDLGAEWDVERCADVECATPRPGGKAGDPVRQRRACPPTVTTGDCSGAACVGHAVGSMRHIGKLVSGAAVLAVAVVGVWSAQASAHVTINTLGPVTQGSFAKVGFSVPNERDDAGTVELQRAAAAGPPAGVRVGAADARLGHRDDDAHARRAAGGRGRVDHRGRRHDHVDGDR